MDEIWEARRKQLADQVVLASVGLLNHTHAASFAIPLPNGACIVAGPHETVGELARAAFAAVEGAANDDEKDC